MWRRVTILALCCAAAGCAHRRAEAPATQPAPVVYLDQPAVALAFAPPAVTSAPAVVATGGTALPADDRAWRQPRAFVGYDSTITEFYWLRTDDRVRFYPGYGGGYGGYGTGNHDRYERRAVTTRFGVRYR